MNTKPVLAIHCMTYNHAPYITDAMNGFCMQQTSFPYVAIIVDDASTDGEPEVIKHYLNDFFDMPNAQRWETDDAYFIEASHKENKNCTFAVVLLKYNFYQLRKDKNPLISQWNDSAKYIAMCEGDDYWIAEDKLQKQIEFLENHEDYVMCYSGFINVDEKGEEIFRENYERMMQKSTSGDILRLLIETNFILTCTTIFRNSVHKEYCKQGFTFGHDYTRFIFATIYGYSKYFSTKMSAYRKTSTGAMATRKEAIGRCFHETRLFFYNSLCENKLPLAPKRFTSEIKRKIATISLFVDNNEYKDRYRKVLQHKVLWRYLPLLLLKKLYVRMF